MAGPNAWDDDWETAADIQPEPPKKPSSKVTKAQRRAQQAEFNRQLWEEAEAPNYFLETRGVPKADFKPPPILLSRKAPVPVSDEANGDVSSDEGDEKKKPTIEEQRALAAKEREEKQRKYEERRLELFGATRTTAATSTTTTSPTAAAAAITTTKAGSGTLSPGETPPGSRSATPNRARGGRGVGRKATESSRALSSTSSLSLKPSSIGPSLTTTTRELFDPYCTAKPKTTLTRPESPEKVIEPIRSPRGPDGSGRGGFGFAPRGGRNVLPAGSEMAMQRSGDLGDADARSD